MKATLRSISLVALTSATAFGQPASPRPAFEVASIRPCRGGDSPGAGATKGGSPGGSGGSPSPGRLILNCATVTGLIQQAYGTYANGHPNPRWSVPPISGGPAWIDSDRYDINAKAQDSASREMMNGPMLQALLEDRFKLKTRRETREIPVYELTVAKGGPKLQSFKDGSCTPLDRTKALPPPRAPGQTPLCNGMILLKGSSMGTANLQGTTLDEFSKSIGLMLDRPIIDITGIAGRFDFRLEFALDQSTPGFFLPGGGAQVAGPSDPAGPSIFTAVQEQLGLKLEPAKGPREFLIINRVERPSEN